MHCMYIGYFSLRLYFILVFVIVKYFVPSVLWCCWLGGRKGIQSVKKLSGGMLVWLSVWSDEVQIAYGPAAATDTRCLLLQ